LGTNYTIEEIDQYTRFFKEFQDTFAWNYDDLKEYDKSIFQNLIPLKKGSKPFKQKLRMMNPKIKPLVKIEIEKLKKDGIIFFVIYLEWLSNHVVVRKNNGEICLCVDFRDLNQASIKDINRLPNMEMFF
jgi:hypothetical protein